MKNLIHFKIHISQKKSGGWFHLGTLQPSHLNSLKYSYIMNIQTQKITDTIWNLFILEFFSRFISRSSISRWKQIVLIFHLIQFSESMEIDLCAFLPHSVCIRSTIRSFACRTWWYCPQSLQPDNYGGIEYFVNERFSRRTHSLAEAQLIIHWLYHCVFSLFSWNS